MTKRECITHHELDFEEYCWEDEDCNLFEKIRCKRCHKNKGEIDQIEPRSTEPYTNREMKRRVKQREKIKRKYDKT